MVTEGTILLIITQVDSVFKKMHMPGFCKYKYLHVKIASLAIVKSGHFCGWQIFCLVHLPWISSQP